MFIVFGVHWTILILALHVFHRNDSDDIRRNCFVVKFGFLLHCACTSYSIMFHISEYASKFVLGEECGHRKTAIISYHILLSLENIILVCLAVWQTPATVTLTQNLEKTMLFVVFAGVIAATMFVVLHYHYHSLSDFEQEDNNCGEPQINHSGTRNVAMSENFPHTTSEKDEATMTESDV